MAKKIRSGVYRCDRGYVASTKSGTVRVAGGKLVPYDLPYEVMDGREHLFTDISGPRGEVVEQATAAPGEKRATRRRSKPASEASVEEAGFEDKAGA